MFDGLKGKKWLIWVLAAVGEIAVMLLVFRVGEVVGVDRANFNAAWSRNYGAFFGEPHPGFFQEVGTLPPPISAFGSAGTVLSVQGNQLVIEDSHMNEKAVTVSSSTTIREGNGVILVGNIATGSQIVIIGAPDSQGQIDARFIRVFPDESEVSSTGQ